MAKFPKNRFCVTFLILLLVSLVLVSSFGTTGCQPIRNLFGGEETKKQSKNSFQKRLKDEDVPGQDIKDFPRYTGSRRVSYTILTGESGKKSGVVVYQSPDDKSKVIDFYTGVAATKGWATNEVIDTSEGRIFQFSKDSRRISLTIARRPRANYTEITIQYREY